MEKSIETIKKKNRLMGSKKSRLHWGNFFIFDEHVAIYFNKKNTHVKGREGNNSTSKSRISATDYLLTIELKIK